MITRIARMLGRSVHDLTFILRYGVSGVAGGLIQLLFDYIAVDILGRWYMEGVIVGFIVALMVTFTLQKYWTFRDNSREQSVRQFVFYTTISILSLIANAVLMRMFVEVLSFWYIWSQILTIIIVSGSSFLFHTFVTFKK